MLTIKDVLATPGQGGFFFDDQQAIKAGAVLDGAYYRGQTATTGYHSVREAAETVCILLILSDGYVAIGDCASVQYSGACGRDPRLNCAALAALVEGELRTFLVGRKVAGFRSLATEAEAFLRERSSFSKAAAYGLSQALLDAASHARGHHLMARVIQDEWAIEAPLAAVPIYGQTGEDRYSNVDKMIMKQVPIIPHGLINTPALVGENGSALIQYVRWIRERIQTLRPTPNYVPVIHLDVYSLIGHVTGRSVEAMVSVLKSLEQAASPHCLQIEHPLDGGSLENQIFEMRNLRAALRMTGSHVRLVADEWVNTLEDIEKFATAQAADLIQIKTPDLGSLHNTVDAILTCQRNGTGAVLGGSCAETDNSARACVHIGIATGVHQILAKPGMGFDEGYMIIANEMARALRLSTFFE